MKKMKINVYLLWAIVIAILFMVLITIFGFFLTPNVNYEGAMNGTNLFFGETHPLQPETIPTIINGITAVTSIIIGLSGAILGLVYREDFTKDKRSKLALLGFVFYFAVPFTFLLSVYNSLIYGALSFALKLALDALVLALMEFVLSMLAIYIRLDSHKETESENKQLPPTKSTSELAKKEEVNPETASSSELNVGEERMNDRLTKEEIKEIIENERDAIKKLTSEILDLENEPKNAIKIKQKIVEIQSSINKMASYADTVKYRLDGFSEMANALLGLLSVSPTEEERKDYEALILKPPKELSKTIGIKVNANGLGAHHNISYPIWWSIVITPLDIYCCYANSIAFDLNDNVWRWRKLFKTKVSFKNINLGINLNI